MSDCFDHESDAYESLLNGGDEEPDGYCSGSLYIPLRPTTKTCNNCGVGGLHWKRTVYGWKLYDADSKRHMCGHKKDKPVKPAGVSIALASVLKDVHRLCEADLRKLHTEVDRLIWPGEED